MGTRVTITLPDAVFRQAQATARQARRPVPEVLVEALAQAFPAVYVSPDREAMEREQEAYERLRESLLATHEGQYVAIHGGELVDADADQMALVRRIKAGYPDRVVHIRQVRRDPEPELIFRSPRIVD
jgi:predicted transcriptional regulator